MTAIASRAEASPRDGRDKPGAKGCLTREALLDAPLLTGLSAITRSQVHRCCPEGRRRLDLRGVDRARGPDLRRVPWRQLTAESGMSRFGGWRTSCHAVRKPSSLSTASAAAAPWFTSPQGISTQTALGPMDTSRTRQGKSRTGDLSRAREVVRHCDLTGAHDRFAVT